MPGAAPAASNPPAMRGAGAPLPGPQPLDRLFDALEAAFDHEQAALVAGDPAALQAASAARLPLVRDLGSTLASAPAAERARLRPRLERARQRNEQLARLLTLRAVPARARLLALHAAARGPGQSEALYAADGQATAPRRNPAPAARA